MSKLEEAIYAMNMAGVVHTDSDEFKEILRAAKAWRTQIKLTKERLIAGFNNVDAAIYGYEQALHQYNDTGEG